MIIFVDLERCYDTIMYAKVASVAIFCSLWGTYGCFSTSMANSDSRSQDRKSYLPSFGPVSGFISRIPQTAICIINICFALDSGKNK